MLVQKGFGKKKINYIVLVQKISGLWLKRLANIVSVQRIGKVTWERGNNGTRNKFRKLSFTGKQTVKNLDGVNGSKWCEKKMKFHLVCSFEVLYVYRTYGTYIILMTVRLDS